MQVIIDNKKRNILFYLLILLFLSTINSLKFNNEKNYKFFLINEIEISGLDKIAKHKLLYELNKFKKQNIFLVNKKDIKYIFNKNNFIKDFKIEKQYPNKIKITINEASFIALISKKDKKYFLTDHGKLVLFDEQLNQNLLPIIYGVDAEKYYFKFNNSLKKNNFDLNLIKKYYFFQSNRWDILLTNELIIKFPINHLDEAIKLVNKLMKDPNFQKIKIIDLRIKDKIITRI